MKILKTFILTDNTCTVKHIYHVKKSENRECLCHKIIYLLSMLIVATTNGLLDGNIVILNTTVHIGMRTS